MLTTAHISADFAGRARIGDWVENRADVQRIGGRLAFVNVYLVVNATRIVRQRRLSAWRHRRRRQINTMSAWPHHCGTPHHHGGT